MSASQFQPDPLPIPPQSLDRDWAALANLLQDTDIGVRLKFSRDLAEGVKNNADQAVRVLPELLSQALRETDDIVLDNILQSIQASERPSMETTAVALYLLGAKKSNQVKFRALELLSGDFDLAVHALPSLFWLSSKSDSIDLSEKICKTAEKIRPGAFAAFEQFIDDLLLKEGRERFHYFLRLFDLGLNLSEPIEHATLLVPFLDRAFDLSESQERPELKIKLLDCASLLYFFEAHPQIKNGVLYQLAESRDFLTEVRLALLSMFELGRFEQLEQLKSSQALTTLINICRCYRQARMALPVLTGLAKASEHFPFKFYAALGASVISSCVSEELLDTARAVFSEQKIGRPSSKAEVRELFESARKAFGEVIAGDWIRTIISKEEYALEICNALNHINHASAESIVAILAEVLTDRRQHLAVRIAIAHGAARLYSRIDGFIEALKQVAISECEPMELRVAACHALASGWINDAGTLLEARKALRFLASESSMRLSHAAQGLLYSQRLDYYLWNMTYPLAREYVDFCQTDAEHGAPRTIFLPGGRGIVELASYHREVMPTEVDPVVWRAQLLNKLSSLLVQLVAELKLLHEHAGPSLDYRSGQPVSELRSSLFSALGEELKNSPNQSADVVYGTGLMFELTATLRELEANLSPGS